MKATDRTKTFDRYGRAALSARVVELVDEFNKTRTYKDAIKLAGRLSVIASVALRESYWGEKCQWGINEEEDWLDYHRPVLSKDNEGNITDVKFEWDNAAIRGEP